MKNFTQILILAVASMFVIHTTVYSQTIYTSHNNAKGHWMDESTWSVNDPSAPTMPGDNVNGSTTIVNVYGTVTFKDNGSDLSVTGSATVIIHDTLIIETGLSGGGSSTITVQEDAILIILQESDIAGSFEFTNNGNTVVLDLLSLKGTSEITNNADMYAFSSISKSGGAKINGLSSPFPDGEVLMNTNPELFNLVENAIAIALPISLLYLESKCGQDERVNISWSTASETNNDFFTLWRSYDGVDWHSIGTIPGAGTSTTLNSYSFVDETPTVHDTYYKLSQTDYDGTSEEFEIFSIYCKYNHKKISVSPNPASDFIYFNFYNEHHITGNLEVALYNQQGLLVSKELFNALEHENEHRIDLEMLTKSGNYFMQSKLNGVHFHSTGFVKQ